MDFVRDYPLYFLQLAEGVLGFRVDAQITGVEHELYTLPDLRGKDEKACKTNRTINNASHC